MGKRLYRILGKLLYVALFVTIQVAALIVMFLFFRDQFAYFYIVCMLLSLGASIHILNNTTSNPAYKIAWLIPILLFPIFGGLLYLLFGKIPDDPETARRQPGNTRTDHLYHGTGTRRYGRFGTAGARCGHPGPLSSACLRVSAQRPYPNRISSDW